MQVGGYNPPNDRFTGQVQPFILRIGGAVAYTVGDHKVPAADTAADCLFLMPVEAQRFTPVVAKDIRAARA